MQTIKSIYILILVIGISIQVFGQNFPSKVKNSASMVFTINGKNVLNKVSEDKINNSLMFQEFKKEMRNSNISELQDMGIDFNSRFCYAMEIDSNMIFYLAFIPIKDVEKFEQFAVKTTRTNPKISDELKTIQKNQGSEMISWNNDFAVFISGNYIGNKYRYRYNRFRNDYNYYLESQAIEKVLKEDTAKTMSIKEKSDRVDEILGKKTTLSEKFLNSMMNSIEEEEEIEESNEVIERDAIEIIVDDVEIMEEVDVPPAPEKIEVPDIDEVEEAIEVVSAAPVRKYNSRYNYSDKAEIRNYRNEIRRKLKNQAYEKWERAKKAYITSLFETRKKEAFAKSLESGSIANESSFKSNENKKADGFLWMKNANWNSAIQTMTAGLYDYSYRSRYRRRSMYSPYMLMNSSLNYLAGDISVANLFFEKDGIRFKQKTINRNATKKITNDIYSTSQDSRFLKYVNGSDYIAFLSTSISSEGLMKQFPKLYTQILSNVWRDSKEEMEVLSDFMEVFMDEKALGEIATGNAMFVLKDLSEKEITYKTYEYDENFKRTWVDKTKKEFLPDFLLMFTSENSDLLNKFFKLGIKHKVVTESGAYFTTKNGNSKLPLDMFFAIKEGIVFLTTDENEIKTILKGGQMSGMNKTHSKMVRKNSQVIYYNHDKLMQKFPVSTLKRRREKEAFALIKEYECKDIMLTAENVNGNLVSEGFVHTPNNGENGALYLFNYLNRIIEFNKF